MRKFLDLSVGNAAFLSVSWYMQNHFDPFTADPAKAFHFAILVSPTIFNFWHSGALALRTERQSARMSEI